MKRGLFPGVGIVSYSEAQGIEAEIPQAFPLEKPRNWSGKPGSRRRRECARKRQNPQM
jgi:hypothetical protein